MFEYSSAVRKVAWHESEMLSAVKLRAHVRRAEWGIGEFIVRLVHENKVSIPWCAQ